MGEGMMNRPASVMADALADAGGELLVARLRGDLGDVGREHPGDARRVEHQLPLQPLAVAAEAAQHPRQPRRLGRFGRRARPGRVSAAAA